MNGFTNTFLKINWLVVLCIFIYDSKRKETKIVNQPAVKIKIAGGKTVTF